MNQDQSRPGLYAGIGVLWLLVALVLGASGRIALLRPPGPQLVLLGLSALLIAAWATISGFRAWLFSLDPRTIVAFHLTRFVGIPFLVLYSRGELPFEFAVPAGWGDIVVACGALALLFVRDLGSRRTLLTVWNLVGLIDIIAVVVIAARLALADPASMQALLQFPMNLLITFVVPLIISSHVLLIFRLRLVPASQPT